MKVDLKTPLALQMGRLPREQHSAFALGSESVVSIEMPRRTGRWVRSRYLLLIVVEELVEAQLVVATANSIAVEVLLVQD